MSMTIYKAVLLLPVALGGCFATSVKGMREREPALVADSTRTPTTITNCVSETWLKGGMTPKAVPRENGATVMIEQPALYYVMPVMVVDADTTPGGSHVVMHLFKSMWSKPNRARVEEVRACL